jgi:hypothetical protein
MNDMQLHLQKLLADAEECAFISSVATSQEKKELFARLAQHMRVLASEIERAIASRIADGEA